MSWYVVFNRTGRETTNASEATFPQVTTPDVAETEVPLQSAPSQVRPGHAELVITRGAVSEADTHLPINAQSTMIGRDQTCDIVLDDPTVSRHHAKLYGLDNDRYAISDLGSLNGIYVNRRSVQHAELADGDEIWIGKIRLRFHRSPVTSAG